MSLPILNSGVIVIEVSQLQAMLRDLFREHTQTVAANAANARQTHLSAQHRASFRTRAETATALGISLATLNTRLHDDKTIPFIRIGRRILIPESFFTALAQPTS